MICDRIESLLNYKALVPQFEAVAEFLKNNDLQTLEIGRYELGGGVFMNVSEYEPYQCADKWEAHRKYADLQIVVSGDERMDSAPVSAGSGASVYSEKDDFQLLDSCGESITQVFAKPGMFAYFAPCDAHRPGIKFTAAKVKKAVVKIPV